MKPTKIAVGLFLLICIIILSSCRPQGKENQEAGFFFGIDIDKLKYPVTGIDVSNHTGKIDFQKVKEQNIDFVFIRSTGGRTVKDQMFEKNYLGAKKSDIPIGVYHFFRFNKSGKSQAINFLSAIKGKKFDLPLVLDIEDWKNPTTKSRAEIIYEIDQFITSVERETGLSLMIYTNENGYKKYVYEKFSHKNIWICSFNKKPRINGKWTFWQYSHKGRFNFAEGVVDINTYNGDTAEWNRYLKK
jgi:lysozyme